MARSAVRLSFEGDDSDLQGTFDDVGSGARDMEDDIAQAASNMADLDTGMVNAAARADVASTAFTGVADVMGFMEEQMGLPLGPAEELTRGFGDLAGAGAALLPMIGQLPTLIKAVGAAMITPPLGIVVAIGAAVAALILLYQNSETFREIVNGAFKAVRDVAVGAFEKIKGVAMTAWNWISDNWPLILAILTGPFAPFVLAMTKWRDETIGLAQAAYDFVTGLWDDLVGFVKKLPGRITSGVAGLFDEMENLATGAYNWATTKFDELVGFVGGLPGRMTSGVAGLFTQIETLATGARDWAQARFDELVGFVSGLPGRITGAATGAFGGITDAFASALNGLIDLWNGLHIPGFTVPRISIDIPKVEKFGVSIGGGSFGVGPYSFGPFSLPNIPRLHEGGTVPGNPTEDILAVLRGGERVITPAQNMGDNVYITVQALDPRTAAKGVKEALDEYERRNGRRFVRTQ